MVACATHTALGASQALLKSSKIDVVTAFSLHNAPAQCTDKALLATCQKQHLRVVVGGWHW